MKGDLKPVQMSRLTQRAVYSSVSRTCLEEFFHFLIVLSKIVQVISLLRVWDVIDGTAQNCRWDKSGSSHVFI
jgi:hypothetical protein